jgi:hypothetical protein
MKSWTSSCRLAWIALQSDHVIAPLFDDLDTRRALAIHRIRRHDAAFSDSIASSLGTAVISLDYAAVAS